MRGHKDRSPSKCYEINLEYLLKLENEIVDVYLCLHFKSFRGGSVSTWACKVGLEFRQ